MPQHDYNIADQLFPAFRADMNAAFAAGQTKNSGDASPGVTFPFMWWVDTSGDNAEWKVRTEANSAWVTQGVLANTVWTPYFQGDPLGNACIKAVGTNTGQLPPAESVLLKSGGTMVGELVLAGAPTSANHAATKAYADGIVGVPTGMCLPYFGGDVPTGYLLCDGSAVSRVTYAALFAKVSTQHGAGDGINTFNLPDMRDRTAVGVSGTKALASTGGAATISTVPPHKHGVDLDTGAFGDHTHTFTTGIESAQHTHNVVASGVAANAQSGAGVAGGSANNGATGVENQTHTHSGTTNLSSIGDHFHDVLGDTANTGENIAAGAVSVQNPYVACRWMIKT